MTEQIYKKNTIIALDAMGGDHGPSVTIPAAIKSIKEKKISYSFGSIDALVNFIFKEKSNNEASLE